MASSQAWKKKRMVNKVCKHTNANPTAADKPCSMKLNQNTTQVNVSPEHAAVHVLGVSQV